MAVSAQIGAIGGLRKKKKRYAPMVQEQAKRGIATQMVMDRKNIELQEEQRAFQEEGLDIQREQFAQQQDQWNQEYALKQQEQAAASQRWQQEQAFAEKKRKSDMMMGGLSLAGNLIGTFFDLF